MAAVSRVGPPTPCPSTFRTCICVSGQAAHEGTMPVSKVMAVITVFIVTASGVPTPLMPDRFVGKEADIHANQAGVVDCVRRSPPPPSPARSTMRRVRPFGGMPALRRVDAVVLALALVFT